MGRTSHTLNFRTSNTNYSCRSYDDIGPEYWLYGTPYYTPAAIRFRAGNQACTVGAVSPSSPYASKLQFRKDGVTYAAAKHWLEYNPTWTTYGTLSTSTNGVVTQTYTVRTDYDQLYNDTTLMNMVVGITVDGDISGSATPPTIIINGVAYTYPGLTPGTHYYYFRIRADYAGYGSGVDSSVTLNAGYFLAPGPDPDPPYSWSMTGYRVVPW